MSVTHLATRIKKTEPAVAILLLIVYYFERRHEKANIDDKTGSSVRMKDADGFHVDIAQVDVIPQDMTAIKMNVRDFDEAYDFLTAHGFTIVPGGKITDTGSSKSVMMVSPSGYAINVAYHFRER